MSERDLTLVMHTSDLLPRQAKLASGFRKTHPELFKIQRSWAAAQDVLRGAVNLFEDYRRRVEGKIEGAAFRRFED